MLPLTTSEGSDPAARYRLAEKLKGMIMRDADDSYDEYRRVIDIEWSQSRISGEGYENKKGWSAVCELI